MPNIELSFAMDPNPRNRAIFDGRARPDAIDLHCSEVKPSELFWRQLRFAQFDISEMSISSFLITLANGGDRWIGLPIFTTRRFFHTTILVRRDSGIDSPADMKGKKIGVPEFQQTAALWARGILKDEFGVEQTEIEWWMERTPEHSHGGATGFKAPPGTVVNQIPAEENIGTMMLSGALDGTLLWMGRGAQMIDRTDFDLPSHPDVKWLFPDPRAEGVRYYQKTGIHPINHAMVMRKSIAEAHPWAVTNIYKAMVEANELANAERLEHMTYFLDAGLLPPEADAALKFPVVETGVAANRHILELATRYSHDQGLTPRQIPLDEIFAPSTMDE